MCLCRPTNIAAVDPDEVAPQREEHTPFSQATRVSRRDGQLGGDLIERQTEAAKAVDRNQTI